MSLPNTGPNLMNPARPRSKAFQELVGLARSEGDRAAFGSRKSALRQAPVLGGPRATNPAAIERNAAVADALATISDEDLFRYSTGEIRNIEAYQGYDFTARLSELTMPVSVIHGTADATVPIAWGESLHQGIPGRSGTPSRVPTTACCPTQEPSRPCWPGPTASSRRLRPDSPKHAAAPAPSIRLEVI